MCSGTLAANIGRLIASLADQIGATPLSLPGVIGGSVLLFGPGLLANRLPRALPLRKSPLQACAPLPYRIRFTKSI